MVLDPFGRVAERKMDLLKKNYPRIIFWILFPVFFTSDLFLSYADFSYEAKGYIFLCGIFLPCLGAWGVGRFYQREDLFREETISPAMPQWVWVLAVLLFLCLRFYRLTFSFADPTGDEGLHGFLAIPLVSRWSWQFFYTVGEHPPLLIWSLVPFFKWFDSPFFDLWFLPAFFSSLVVPTGYWVSKRFFSKSFSLVFGFLLAFSFWPVFFGQFCHQGLFVPFWELFGFVLLSFLLSENESKKQMSRAFFLGVWIGLGSLTFTAWAVVILLFCGIMTGWMSRAPKARSMPSIAFSGGLLLGLLPFLFAVVHQGYGHHLIDTSAVSHYFSLAQQFSTHLSYITCLFWGSLQDNSSYAPTWGGILNPILSSFFFIGLLELFYHWQEKITWWILGAFLILLLPGLLSADYVEFNRIIQIMPILLLVVVLGVQRGLISLPVDKRWIFIPVFLVSFLLDVNHLLKPIVEGPVWKLDFKKEQKNETLEAYRILNAQYKEKGPGLIFTDFLPLSHGHVLHVLSYHFNTAINPRLSDWNPTWAAVIVNSDYQIYLQKRFPGATWKPVTSQHPEQGGMVVGIIPVNDGDRSTLNYWNQVHQYFYQLNLKTENMYNTPQVYAFFSQKLVEGFSLVKNDRFLLSCWSEWFTQFAWDVRYPQKIALLQEAIKHGYPVAHLYLELGEFYYLTNHLSEAKTAFEKAARYIPGQTDAEDWLREIRSNEVKNRSQ